MAKTVKFEQKFHSFKGRKKQKIISIFKKSKNHSRTVLNELNVMKMAESMKQLKRFKKNRMAPHQLLPCLLQEDLPP